MNSWTTRLPTPFVPEYNGPVFENEPALKLQFAAAYLKSPNDAFKAAAKVVGNNTNAMWVATHWPNDLAVKAEMERLKGEKDELEFLPTKAEIAREIYELSNKERLTQSDKLALDAKVAYAKLMGWIAEGGKGSTTNVNAGKGASVQIVASDLDEKL